MSNYARTRAIFASAFLALTSGALSFPRQLDNESCVQRTEFGGWLQQDRKNTRVRVLERYAIGKLVYETGGPSIEVLAGSWLDPYTGLKFQDVDASTIEIDHIVPACFAWSHGAEAWSSAERRTFFNDTRFLRPVEANLNRSKGKKAPNQFMPINRDFACTYASLFLEAVQKYHLVLSTEEDSSIRHAQVFACKAVASAGL